MPRERRCDFCESAIEPGTGTMFVRTDGTTIHFCSSKCEKNADLGRESRDLEWTGREQEETEPEQAEDEETEPEQAEEETEAQPEESDEQTETEETEAQA